MNLTGDPWIPVICANGESKTVSLRELYANAENIRDLNATPPQRIALTRLLVCITQAALDGPQNEQDWYECRDRICSESTKYLDAHESEFELYGDRPFLQVKDLTAVKKDCFKMPMDKLDIQLACGKSSHTLFDHRARATVPRLHPDSRIALSLLTLQSFALGGGKSKKASWSQELVDGKMNKKDNNNFTAAPCVGSKLFTLLRGDNLKDSIHLNVLSKTVLSSGIPTGSFGRPIWEDFPRSYKSPTIDSEHRFTLLGRLVPLSRVLCLDDNDLQCIHIFTNGYVYPDSPDEFRDPMLTVTTSSNTQGDEERHYLRIAPNKHPWRNLYSILARRGTGALALHHVTTLNRVHPARFVEVWVGGLLSDQAKPLEMCEWHFGFHADDLCSIDFVKYENGVNLASKGESQLKRAISRYLEFLSVSEFAMNTEKSGSYKRNDPRGKNFRQKVLQKAVLHFWSRLDGLSQKLIRVCRDQEKSLGDVWHPFVREAMEHAYAFACPHETSRQIQAFAQGSRKLRLKKPDE